MTPAEYTSTLRELGLNQTRAAKVLRIGYRQGLRYKKGNSGVPGPVEALLKIYLDIKSSSAPEYLEYVYKLIGG
jgi:hypothetical protein